MKSTCASDHPTPRDAQLHCADSQRQQKPIIVVKQPVLASFVVLAYNQEQYIREAVEGAFAQTYSPLEIILSDDCSSDSTFAIMQSMAQHYQGPHTIVLNRNEKNLGIARHVNKTFALAQGEIWIAAAGDDISLPHRTSTLIHYFETTPSCMAIASSVRLFGDESGAVISAAPNRKKGLFELCLDPPPPRGCAAAYKRDLYRFFGPISTNTIAEDMAYSFRAGLIGIYLTIPDVLVLYRVSRSSISLGGTSFNDKHRQLVIKVSGALQNLSDFEYLYPQRTLYHSLCRLLLLFSLHSLKRQLSRACLTPTFSDKLILFCYVSLSRILKFLHFRDWRDRYCRIKNFNNV